MAPTGAPVEWVAEESYFFRLSRFAEPLREHILANPEFISPVSRRNEVVSFMREGLRDLSVSRTTFSWGIECPPELDGGEGPNPAEGNQHIMYVWLDALANYLSAIGYPDTSSAHFDKFWPAGLHMVGKDILRFHAIYWPAFLMAAGLPLPKKLFAHGWWMNNGEKMSKSIGNVIDPVALVEKYGTDNVRYFMINEVAFGGDGDFSDRQVSHESRTSRTHESYTSLTQVSHKSHTQVAHTSLTQVAHPSLTQVSHNSHTQVAHTSRTHRSHPQVSPKSHPSLTQVSPKSHPSLTPEFAHMPHPLLPTHAIRDSSPFVSFVRSGNSSSASTPSWRMISAIWRTARSRSPTRTATPRCPHLASSRMQIGRCSRRRTRCCRNVASSSIASRSTGSHRRSRQ